MMYAFIRVDGALFGVGDLKKKSYVFSHPSPVDVMSSSLLITM